jgi:hypothetical protein
MFDAFELAPGCLEFLEMATTRFRCRWLSARSQWGLAGWITSGIPGCWCASR